MHASTPIRRLVAPEASVAAGFAEAAALIIPLFIVGAVLAMGVERRVRERALLALAGAGPGALRTLEALRGALIGTGGAVVGIVLAAAFAAAAGRDLELTAGAVLVPGSVALITSAWALTLSAQTARVRLGAIQSVPGLPPWSLVQRELARGGGLLAVALLAAVIGAWLGGLPAAVGALIGAVAALLSLSLLGTAIVVLPAFLPLPTGLRAAMQGAARARWVSGPAASAFAIASVLLVFSILDAAGQLQSGDQPGLGGARGDAHLAAIRASTLTDARGRLVAPVSAARAATATLPGARVVAVQAAWGRSSRFDAFSSIEDGRLYVARSADLVRLGVPPGVPREGVLLDLGEAPDGGPQPARPDRPGHDRAAGAAGCTFGAGLAGVAPAPVRRCADRTAGQAVDGTAVGVPRGLVRADRWRTRIGAARRGRARRSRRVDRGRRARHGAREPDRPAERVRFGSLELALALVFGGVATALVLAEMRAESRLLLLAGARPLDHRLRAAAAAFTLGAAGVLLVVIGVVFLCGFAATFGSSASALAAVGPTLLPLLLAPFLLALGAGLSVRPATRIGRIGRVPRDAASSLH